MPGVADACIALQDQAKVDVNILFFLLWNATQGRAFNAADVTEIERRIGPWRDMAVVPIRNVRRALKSPPPVMRAGRRRRPAHPDQGGGARGRAAAAGGALRRSRRPSRLGRPAASKVEAARDSISSYQGVIGPFPPEPLDTVLSAFAKFDAPGSG